MTVSFAGRAVVITGAGGGIGRSHALEFARRGAMVLVNDLGGDVAGRGGSASMASSVVQEIHAFGGKAVANHDSVATTGGTEAIVAQALAAFGRIDVLVNNAGIMRNTRLEDTSDEDWDAILATHLTGSFRLIRAAWPHMKAQGYGRIVNTASSTGLFGQAFVSGYGPAKAGIVGLTMLAAIEGEPYGILCNALLPNALSRMALQAGADWADKVDMRAQSLPDAVGQSMASEFNTPLAVYLASEACTTTQGLYSHCLGRVARVFAGVVPGWQGSREEPATVEQIAEHWGAICAMDEGFDTPASGSGELAAVLGRHG